MASRARRNPSKYPRVARINEVLREVIADEVERHSDEDSRLELVTITGVDTEPDLRHAKVYFSAMGNTASDEDVTAALDERRVAIQTLINKDMHIKRTPQLAFVVDPAIVEGEKVESILRNIPSSQVSETESSS